MLLTTLTRYGAWADKQFLSALAALPETELVRKRMTVFGNLIHTFNHILVVGSIFQAHLLARSHPFTSLNTEVNPAPPAFQHLGALDQWYVEYGDPLSAQDLEYRVNFNFVGGGTGVMTRAEILAHIVNHGTYHRGMIADMMFQVPAKPPVADLTVYIRDVAQRPDPLHRKLSVPDK
ncbi:hypothetical protein CDEF62S_02205 [Castellaniella defragrans]